MKRRAFLGFLGGVAVAGPQAAKSAAEMTMADLNLPGIGLLGGSGGYGALASAGDSSVRSYNHVDWAKSSLKMLTGLKTPEIERKKLEYHVHQLDPNIAALRSVALVSKIRVSRDAQFAQSQHRERSYLEGIIAGWWE